MIERWEEEGVGLTSIRSGTYKFFLRDIPYNARLEHMGLSDTDRCKWCPNTRESILHLYWQCPHSVDVWKHLANLFSQVYNVTMQIDLKRFLFGHMGENRDNLHPVFDVLCSLTKTYLHKCKCKGIISQNSGLERYIGYIKDIR